jgi:uncharacterized membrane protein YccF (DUF307 family)
MRLLYAYFVPSVDFRLQSEVFVFLFVIWICVSHIVSLNLSYLVILGFTMCLVIV